jgi:DNA-binding transcriptional MocR family regulator
MGRPITWAQVQLDALEDLRGLMRVAPKAAELMLALIEHMQPGAGGVVVASRETMRELLDVSMPTVERALRTLINEGWVQRIRIGSAHALAINERVAWVGPRGDLPHAVFSATVIASRAEQDALSLAPAPMRRVPIVGPDEVVLPVGAGLAPPAQPELPGVSHVVATTAPADPTIAGQQQLPLAMDPMRRLGSP